MLGGLLGRGFAAKCKSLIKLTRSRIDVIRRKRQATQKFLKKDMADLLANGLDINAFGRAEGLLVELTLSSCYDDVDRFCEVLLKQMSTMQKQSGCPEECREAVSSLMFAAARFSDLPELRDLRDRFQERYGNSLDCFIDQEFSNKLAGKPSTLEKKVKLMQDIASEFSIRWDARAFEQRMSRNSSTVQEQPKDHGLLSHATDYSKLTNAKYIPSKGDKLNFPPKQSFEEVDEGQRFHNNMGANGFRRNDLNPQPKLESTGNKWNEFEDVISRKDDHDTQQGRPGLASYKAEEGSSLKQVKSGASSHERRHKDTNGTQRGWLGHSSYKTEEDSSPKPIKSHETGYKDTAGGLKSQNRRERTVLEREQGDGSLHWKQGTLPSSAGTYIKTNVKDAPSANDNNGNEDHAANSLRKASRGDIERSYCKSPLPPPYVKPPYVKPNVKPLKDGKYGSKSESVFEGSKIPKSSVNSIPIFNGHKIPLKNYV